MKILLSAIILLFLLAIINKLYKWKLKRSAHRLPDWLWVKPITCEWSQSPYPLFTLFTFPAFEEINKLSSFVKGLLWLSWLSVIRARHTVDNGLQRSPYLLVKPDMLCCLFKICILSFKPGNKLFIHLAIYIQPRLFRHYAGIFCRLWLWLHGWLISVVRQHCINTPSIFKPNTAARA